MPRRYSWSPLQWGQRRMRAPRSSMMARQSASDAQPSNSRRKPSPCSPVSLVSQAKHCVRTAWYSLISMLASVLAHANLRYDNGRANKFLATGAQRHEKRRPRAPFFSGKRADQRFGLLTWLPTTPPTAAPPTVPSAEPPDRAEPATAPTPAPMAVLRSCVDMPEQAVRPRTAAARVRRMVVCLMFMVFSFGAFDWASNVGRSSGRCLFFLLFGQLHVVPDHFHAGNAAGGGDGGVHFLLAGGKAGQAHFAVIALHGDAGRIDALLLRQGGQHIVGQRRIADLGAGGRCRIGGSTGHQRGQHQAGQHGRQGSQVVHNTLLVW